METRLFQMKYPLADVASWVNHNKIAEGVVAIVPYTQVPEERRYCNERDMVYVFIRLPINHPWAMDQIVREEKYKNMSRGF